MTRDPRTDPRPGDVLFGIGRHEGARRQTRTVVETDKYWVRYVVGRSKYGVEPRSWRAWAKTATIVKTAEQQ